MYRQWRRAYKTWVPSLRVKGSAPAVPIPAVVTAVNTGSTSPASYVINSIVAGDGGPRNQCEQRGFDLYAGIVLGNDGIIGGIDTLRFHAVSAGPHQFTWRGSDSRPS